MIDTLCLTESSPEPLHKQLRRQLEDKIRSGALGPGDPMPPTRKLAEVLGVSRITVVRAYTDLASRGYLKGRIGQGTFVADSHSCRTTFLPDPPPAVGPCPVYGRDYAHRQPGALVDSSSRCSAGYEIERMSSAFGAFEIPPNTRKVWARLLRNHLLNQWSCLISSLEDPFGLATLRASIAGHLARSRGVVCTAEQIVLFSSRMHCRRFLTRLLLGDRTIFATESPCSSQLRRMWLAEGATIHELPLDAQGISMAHLKQIRPAPDVLQVHPYCHAPTAMATSIHRCRELLEWAHNRDAVLIEEEVVGEAAFGMGFPQTLWSLDGGRRVVFVSSLERTLAPLTTLGFLVLPEHMVPIAATSIDLLDSCPPNLEQLVVADFIREGHLDSHLSAMHKLSARRRQALIFALKTSLRSLVDIPSRGAGAGIAIKIHLDLTSDEIISIGMQQGLRIRALDQHPSLETGGKSLVVEFDQDNEENLRLKATAFACALLQKALPDFP